MNNFPGSNKSRTNTDFDEDEIFDDSSFLARFNNSSFKDTRLSESNINDSINKSGFNVSALCCDEEISGYDKLTGKTWIYPTNYPVRDYQFNIIRAAILRNTLVSLPTGLGKTFIAAVIMYNFYRWYPLGKIVFTAPTRPLVAQQIEACYDIIAIPPNDTIEMTGHMQVNTRKQHWQNKRVFFATPQVIYNDIKSGICPGDKIRCLVIDEAHKARGNYAYCQIVSTLTDMGHKTYRVLALSATPGSKVEDVINVVKSLHIAHLELRTESCIDVAPYSHSRKINTVIIPLGPELTQLRQQYVDILDGYARRLKQFNILPQNLGNLSKGRIVMMYKEFQAKDKSVRHPQHNYIMKDFTLLIALYHGLELLVKHGSRVFLNFFDEHPEKSWIQADDRLTALLERLRDDLGVNPLSLDRSILPDGTIPEMPKNLCFGHPKFYRLKEIMIEHFTKAKKIGQDTRAIVFCEYRESVNLVHCLLLQCRPLITPQMFVGQGASGKDGKAIVSQKQQLRVMRAFREGGCNALVATCVAEEGLDVGSVDLILCFDISSRSPIRLVQRCGRTGRERGGQVHILVTEGREHQTLLDCMRQRDGLNKRIQQSREVESNLYKLNPRMMPHDHMPACQKMFITVAKKTDPKAKGKEADKAKKGQKDLRTMLLGRASTSTCTSKEPEAELISETEFRDMFPDGLASANETEAPTELWPLSKETIKTLAKTDDTRNVRLSTWLEWQRTLQKTINIGHSKDTEILASLLQYSDVKRFDLPASTQNPTFNTQELATQNFLQPSPIKSKPKPKKTKPAIIKSPLKLTKSPNKKYGDIRSLFSTATKSTKNYTKLINDLGIPSDGSIPTRIIDLLVDLSLENTNIQKTCYICLNVCDCSLITDIRKHRPKQPFSLKFIIDPKLPDVELIDDIDIESLLMCDKNMSVSNKCVNGNTHRDDYMEQENIEKHNKTTNFDLEFDFGSSDSIVYGEEKTPEKIEQRDDVRKSENKNFDLEFDFDLTDNYDIAASKVENVQNTSEKNFEIGDIEDIFAESSPEEISAAENSKELKDEAEKPKETLGFFGLDSIDDIFADDDSIEIKTEDTVKETPLINVENKINNENNLGNIDIGHNNVIKEQPLEYPMSPSILSGRVKNFPTSPILCTQTRKFQLSTKKPKPSTSTPTINARRQLIKENIDVDTPNKSVSTIRSTMNDSKEKSMFSITQLVNMINKSDNQSVLNQSSVIKSNDVIAINSEDGRSTSPILLTQADRKKAIETDVSSSKNISTTQTSKCTSLIILDSDSDASNDALNNTQLYDVNEKEIKEGNNFEISLNSRNSASPINAKRKLDDDDDDFILASPYFNKKPKLDNKNSKQLTLQEKVLAALTSNKTGSFSQNNNDRIINFSISPRKNFTQKENKNPQIQNGETHCFSDDEKDSVRKNNIDMLQMFTRDSKVKSPKDKIKSLLSNKLNNESKSQKRKITFDDSDDDFVEDNFSRRQRPENGFESKPQTDHKARKRKKPKHNSFLELEAEQSDDASGSGDELSDDSAGSIAGFICDDDAEPHVDMHAHYMRSVKSPVKGGAFKIPELPKKFNNMNVFSQFVEEDSYEMDSFCVDSHIGLTQVNEISELELAEIVLEEKRRQKNKSKSQPDPQPDNGDSPVVRRRNKNARQIHSDSDDSS